MPTLPKSTLAKKETTTPDWYVVDGRGEIVGRFATRLATILMGKHKPIYTPHVDCGDCVIVVNAELVRFTGAGVAALLMGWLPMQRAVAKLERLEA